jgi:hypothetical protein
MNTKPLSRYDARAKRLVVDLATTIEVEPYILNGKDTGQYHPKGQAPARPYEQPLWKKESLFPTRDEAVAAAQDEAQQFNERLTERRQRPALCPICGHPMDDSNSFEDASGTGRRHEWC